MRNASYLADLMGVGILRLDDSLRVELANPAAHVLLGRAPGSIVGRSAMEAFVDARFEESPRRPATRGSASGEFRVRGPDGPTLVIRARRSPVSGVWIVLEDVSELRRLQQIRAEFIDNLSHELRTPLTTISLLAETLARDADAAGDAVPAKMRDRITKIEVETGHLVQMVNELLDLARIESGGPLVLLDDVDLGRRRRRVRRAAPPLRRTPGTAARRRRPRRPAARSAATRPGSARSSSTSSTTRVKFSDDGGEVTVRVREEDGELVVSVEDHGIGVPKADQARIFERFYKVDRARVRGGGTGLGLSIARNVLQQHGGRIWVESEEGVGSTFSFALPISGRLRTRQTERDGPRSRRDAQHPQPGRPLGRAPAAAPRRHGRAPAGRARAPGGRLPAPAGPADRRGGRGPVRGVPGWAGRPEYGNAMLVREPLAADACRSGSSSG